MPRSNQPRRCTRSGRVRTGNWQLICDNTRTCRAAGYSDEAADAAGVSVLLTRQSGAAQPVSIDLKIAERSNDGPNSVRMMIGKRDLGPVALDPIPRTGTLSAARTTALLGAVLHDNAIWSQAGTDQWVLSSAGANAVLLKMDEFQGRLGTTGALVAKGSQGESAVLSPILVTSIEEPR